MMKDKDLFEIWNSNDAQQRARFLKEEKNLREIYSKRSNDVFSKISRNIVWESIIGVIVSIIFPFFFYGLGWVFWVIVGLMLIALAVSLFLNYVYLKRINSIHDQDLLHATRSKVEVLRYYLKKLKITVNVITPIAFVVGMLVPLQDVEMTLGKLVFVLLFVSPFLALLLWLFKKYIHFMYGKYLVEMEDVLTEIEEE